MDITDQQIHRADTERTRAMAVQFLKSPAARQDFPAALAAEDDPQTLCAVRNYLRTARTTGWVCGIVVLIGFGALTTMVLATSNPPVLHVAGYLALTFVVPAATVSQFYIHGDHRRLQATETRLGLDRRTIPHELSVTDPMVSDWLAASLAEDEMSLTITTDEMELLQQRTAAYNAQQNDRMQPKVTFDLVQELSKALRIYRQEKNRPKLIFPDQQTTAQGCQP